MLARIQAPKEKNFNFDTHIVTERNERVVQLAREKSTRSKLSTCAPCKKARVMETFIKYTHIHTRDYKKAKNVLALAKQSRYF